MANEFLLPGQEEAVVDTSGNLGIQYLDEAANRVGAELESLAPNSALQAQFEAPEEVAPEVDPKTKAVIPPRTLKLSPTQLALLDAIADVESNGDQWNQIVGGKTFNSYDDHPRVTGVRTKDGPSSAAGRYQIVASTYDDYAKRLGIKGFSPDVQDVIALSLAENDYRVRSGGRDLYKDLEGGKAENVRKILAGKGKETTWQGLQNDPDFVNRFNTYREKYSAGSDSWHPPMAKRPASSIPASPDEGSSVTANKPLPSQVTSGVAVPENNQITDLDTKVKTGLEDLDPSKLPDELRSVYDRINESASSYKKNVDDIIAKSEARINELQDKFEETQEYKDAFSVYEGSVNTLAQDVLKKYVENSNGYLSLKYRLQNDLRNNAISEEYANEQLNNYINKAIGNRPEYADSKKKLDETFNESYKSLINSYIKNDPISSEYQDSLNKLNENYNAEGAAFKKEWDDRVASINKTIDLMTCGPDIPEEECQTSTKYNKVEPSSYDIQKKLDAAWKNSSAAIMMNSALKAQIIEPLEEQKKAALRREFNEMSPIDFGLQYIEDPMGKASKYGDPNLGMYEVTNTALQTYTKKLEEAKKLTEQSLSSKYGDRYEKLVKELTAVSSLKNADQEYLNRARDITKKYEDILKDEDFQFVIKQVPQFYNRALEDSEEIIDKYKQRGKVDFKKKVQAWANRHPVLAAIGSTTLGALGGLLSIPSIASELYGEVAGKIIDPSRMAPVSLTLAPTTSVAGFRELGEYGRVISQELMDVPMSEAMQGQATEQRTVTKDGYQIVWEGDSDQVAYIRNPDGTFFKGTKQASDDVVNSAKGLKRETNWNGLAFTGQALEAVSYMLPVIAASFVTAGTGASAAAMSLGSFTAGFSQMSTMAFNESLKEAGLSVDEALGLATAIGFGGGLIETFNPIEGMMFKKGLSAAFIRENAARLAAGKATFSEISYNAAKNFVKGGLKEFAFEELPQHFLETSLKKLSNSYLGSDFQNLEMNKEQLLDLAMVSIGIGGIAEATRSGGRSYFGKEAIKAIVSNPAIYNDFMSGFETTNPTLAAEYRSAIDPILNEINSVENLAPNKKIKAAEILYDLRTVNKQLESVKSDSVKNKKLAEKAELEKKLDALLERPSQDTAADTQRESLLEALDNELARSQAATQAAVDEAGNLSDQIASAQLNQRIQFVESRMDNADYIEGEELNDVANDLYGLWDKVDSMEGLSQEEKESVKSAIENKIEKLEQYEFSTTTQAGETLKTATVKGTRVIGRTTKATPSKFQVTPTRIAKQGATTVTRADGSTVSGSFSRNSDGTISVRIFDGTSTDARRGTVGATTVKVDPSTLEFVETQKDANGTVTGATIYDPNNDLSYAITDPDLALDMAIKAKTLALGPIDEAVFEQVYEQVLEEVDPGAPKTVLRDGTVVSMSALEKRAGEVSKRIREIENLLKGDLYKSQRTKLKRELNNLKKERNAIQKQKASAKAVRNKPKAGRKVDQEVRPGSQEAAGVSQEEATETEVTGETQADQAQPTSAGMMRDPMGGVEFSPTGDPDTYKSKIVRLLVDTGEKLGADFIDTELIEKIYVALNNVGSIFNRLGVNTAIYLHRNSEDYYNAINSLYAPNADGSRAYEPNTQDKSPDALYSIDVNTGASRIDLNLETINPKIILHEATHAILNHYFGDNPKVFKVFRNKIFKVLNTSLNKKSFIKKGIDPSKLINYLKEFESRYADETARPEEFLAEFSALMSTLQDTAFMLKPSLWRDIFKFYADIIRKITGGLISLGSPVSSYEVVYFFNGIAASYVNPLNTDFINSQAELLQKEIAGDPSLFSQGDSLGFVNNLRSSQSLPSTGRKASTVPKATLKGKPNELGDVKIVDKKEFLGKRLAVGMSDATGVLDYISKKTGVTVEGLMGGGLFPFMKAMRKAGVAWASVTPQAARQMYELAIGTYATMIYRMNKATSSLGNLDFNEVALAELELVFKGKSYTAEQKEELNKKIKEKRDQIKNIQDLLDKKKELSDAYKLNSTEDLKNKIKDLNKQIKDTGGASKSRIESLEEEISQLEISQVDEATFIDLLNKRLASLKGTIKVKDEATGETKKVSVPLLQIINKGENLENWEDFKNKITAISAFPNRGSIWSRLLKNDVEAKATTPWYKLLQNKNIATLSEIIAGIDEKFLENAADGDIVAALKIAEPKYTKDGILIIHTPRKELVNEAKGIYYIDAPIHRSYPYYILGQPIGVLNEFNSIYEWFPGVKQLMREKKLSHPHKVVESMGKQLAELYYEVSSLSSTGRGPLPAAVNEEIEKGKKTVSEEIKETLDAAEKEQNPIKKQELIGKASLAVHEASGFVPVDFWVSQLQGKTAYLDEVVKRIYQARQDLIKGRVTKERVIKAFLITIGSKGSQGGRYSEWRKKHRKGMPDLFIENENRRDKKGMLKQVKWVRPEGATAAYLSTFEGQELIRKLADGTATKNQVHALWLYLGFGLDNSKTKDVMNTLENDGFTKFTELANKIRYKDSEALYNGAMELFAGVKEGKTGFFNQFLGLSSRGVVDARELDAWFFGKEEISDIAERDPVLAEKVAGLRKKAEASGTKAGLELINKLLDRIYEVGIGLGYKKDIAAYIAHHAIWDGIKDQMTTHMGEYSIVADGYIPKSMMTVPSSKDWTPSMTEDQVEEASNGRYIDSQGKDLTDSSFNRAKKEYAADLYKMWSNWFNDKLGSFKGSTILDIGSGFGSVHKNFNFDADIRSSEPMYDSTVFKEESGLNKPTYTRADGEDIPIEAFDFVLNSGSISEYPADVRESVIRTAARALKPEGAAIFNAMTTEYTDFLKDKIRRDPGFGKVISDTEVLVKDGERFVYVKGYTQKEFEAYVSDILGSNYNVITAPEGVKSMATVVVEKSLAPSRLVSKASLPSMDAVGLELTKAVNISPEQAGSLSKVVRIVKNNIAKRMGIPLNDYLRRSAIRVVPSVKDFLTDIPNSVHSLRGLSSEIIRDFSSSVRETSVAFQGTFGKVNDKYIKNNGLTSNDYIMSAILDMDTAGAFKFLGFAEKLSAYRADRIREILNERILDLKDRAENSSEFYIQNFSRKWLQNGQKRATTEMEKDNFQLMLDGNQDVIMAQIEHVQSQQRANLMASLNYLVPSNDYTPEFKFLMMALTLRGASSSPSYIRDAEENIIDTIPGKDLKRTKETVGNHEELSSMVLPNVFRDFNNGDTMHPMELIEKYTDKSVINRDETWELVKDRVFKKADGGYWVKFEKSKEDSDIQALTLVSKKVQKVMAPDDNPWCTGGGMAATYLPQGDFYLFLDAELEPQITVRYEDDKIAELRGTDKGQALSESQANIADKFLDDIPNGKSYKTQVKASKVYHRLKNNIPPTTKQDLQDFLDVFHVDLQTYDSNKRDEFQDLKTNNLNKYILSNKDIKLYDEIVRPSDVESVSVINAFAESYPDSPFLNRKVLVIGDLNYKHFIGRTLPKGLKVLGGVYFTSEKIPTGFTLPEGIQIDENLSFYKSTLPQGFTLPEGIQIGGNLEFASSTLPKDFTLPEGLQINWDLDFNGATLPQGLTLPKGLKVGRDLSFTLATLPQGFTLPEGLQVGRDLRLKDTNIPQGFKLPKDLKVDRDLTFNYVTIPQGFTLPEGLQVGGNLSFARATLPQGFTLPEGLQVGWDLVFHESTIPQGFTLPEGLQIRNNLDFSGATISQGFTLPEGLKVGRGLSFYGTTISQGFTLPEGLQVGGGLSFYGATLPQGFTLPEGLQVGGNLSFYNATIPQGFALPEGLQVGMDLSFNGATLPQGFTIPEGLQVGKDLTFNRAKYTDGTSAEGIFIEWKVRRLMAQQDSRGAIIETPTSVLTLLDKDNADVTTPIHEVAHEYEKVLTADERKVIEDWSGAKFGTTKFREAFAKGAERYLYEGASFNGKVDAIFAKFKEWFKGVIRDAAAYFGDINQLTPTVREVYAKMLADGDIEIQQKPIVARPVAKASMPRGLVRPSNNSWKLSLTQDQVDAKLREYGARTKTENDLLLIENEKGNETQRNNKPTYAAFLRGLLDKFGVEGINSMSILDAGAGFGMGAMAAKEEGVEKSYKTFEPFPSISDGKWKKFSGTDAPNFTSFKNVPDKSQDIVVNNAVLNVVPADIRQTIVEDIGRVLKDGGQAYISVRGIKETALLESLKSAQKGGGKNVYLSDSEYYVTGTQGDYQKGFAEEELKSYIQDVLGSDFTVEISKESFWKNNSSAPKVVVKKTPSTIVSKASMPALQNVESTTKALEGQSFNYINNPGKFILDFIGSVEGRNLNTNWADWFLGESRGAKNRVAFDIQSNPKLSSALMSNLYDLWKKGAKSDVSFEKFIDSEITLYRGGKEGFKNEVDVDGFNTWELTREGAKKFAKDGDVIEKRIPVKNLYGAVDIVGGEIEVLEKTKISDKFAKEIFERPQWLDLVLENLNRDEVSQLKILTKQDKYNQALTLSKRLISQAYHKAKKDGTNPELVKSVEDLLTPSTIVSKASMPALENVESTTKALDGKVKGILENLKPTVTKTGKSFNGLPLSKVTGSIFHRTSTTVSKIKEEGFAVPNMGRAKLGYGVYSNLVSKETSFGGTEVSGDISNLLMIDLTNDDILGSKINDLTNLADENGGVDFNKLTQLLTSNNIDGVITDSEFVVFDPYKIKNIRGTDAKSTSEAYHQAKKDGTNPVLVKAVENELAPGRLVPKASMPLTQAANNGLAKISMTEKGPLTKEEHNRLIDGLVEFVTSEATKSSKAGVPYKLSNFMTSVINGELGTPIPMDATTAAAIFTEAGVVTTGAGTSVQSDVLKKAMVAAGFPVEIADMMSKGDTLFEYAAQKQIGIKRC